MGEIVLRSDTKSTEFGHLTTIDLELNSIILELVYLTCLGFEYGKPGEFYLFKYDAKITALDYKNPLHIFGYFGNVSKKSVEWVLARTLFYKEEKAKRQAEADKKTAEAERIYQSVIEKKLGNLEKAHKLRQKLLKDGIDPDEVNRAVAGLLIDQRATLLIPEREKSI